MMRVLLAGGGTAGHVNPLLATANELRERDPNCALMVVGTAEGLEARLVPQAGLDLVTIPKAALPRRVSAAWLSFPGRLRRAIALARRAVADFAPDVVVGFGGYVSTPAYLAARRSRVPIVVHEGNWRPGLANRIGARYAARVAITFRGTPLARGELTGLPLRRQLAGLDRMAARPTARAALGLDATRPTLLVTGGSLGAQRINEAMAGAAAAILETGAQVLHLAGGGKDGGLREHVASLQGGERYHVRDYLEDMASAYAAADLVVARAGAGTVCELAAVGLGALYVPLAFGNGEQSLNCREVVEAGGGIVRDNADFTPEWAAHQIPALLADGDRLAAMGRAAARVGIADGAARLATMIEEVAR